MPLYYYKPFLLLVVRIERIREQGATGLAKDLDKLGILSLAISYTDSLSFSPRFSVANKQDWLMSTPWYDLHLAKAQVKLYRRYIFSPHLSRRSVKVRGLLALMG